MDSRAPDILYISLANHHGSTNHGHRRGQFWETLERECLLRGMEPQVLGVRPNKFPDPFPEHFKPNLGFIVWINHLQNNEGLFNVLHKCNKPVFFVDEMNDLSFLDQFKLNSQTITIGGESAGKLLAKKSWQAKQSDIAYFSTFHHHHWSRSRLSGLRQGLLDASDGNENKVYGYLVERPDMMKKISPHCGPDDYLIEAGQSEFNQIKLPDLPDGMTDDLRKALDGYLFKISQKEEFQILLLPAFKKAISDKSIKTWVCTNDEIALQAKNFLKREKVNVPEDIAIVGFDNSELAQKQEISSFDFYFPGGALLALKYFGNPDVAEKVIEMPGMLHYRATFHKPD